MSRIRRSARLACFFVLLTGVASGQTPATKPADAIQQYCVTCHNDRLKTAGLTLASLDITHPSAQAETWEKVIRKLRTRAMPPPTAPRPDAETYDALAEYLETSIDRDAAAAPHVGKLAFVHRAVGGITENDITLAATTNATIIGFNVRPDRKARELADAEDVEVRTYEIIYQVLEDIEKAMVGLLAPEFEEVVTGDAEVREIFRIPRVGAIAGCYVQSGVITRGSKVRFLREGVIIWKGSITSLKRFKEDAREVRDGFECGIGLSDFQDLKPGDIIETFEEREIPRT